VEALGRVVSVGCDLVEHVVVLLHEHLLAIGVLLDVEELAVKRVEAALGGFRNLFLQQLVVFFQLLDLAFELEPLLVAGGLLFLLAEQIRVAAFAQVEV